MFVVLVHINNRLIFLAKIIRCDRFFIYWPLICDFFAIWYLEHVSWYGWVENNSPTEEEGLAGQDFSVGHPNLLSKYCLSGQLIRRTKDRGRIFLGVNVQFFISNYHVKFMISKRLTMRIIRRS